MRNKFVRAISCLALVGSLACSLGGCGETAKALDVRLASGNVMLGDVAFYNSETLSISESETGTFVVSGDASFFNDEQANTFWNGTAAKGDAYIVIELNFENGTNIAFTTLTGDKSYTNTEADDVFDIVIALTGSASSGETTRTFTVTRSGEAATTYTVDTSNVNTTAQ